MDQFIRLSSTITLRGPCTPGVFSPSPRSVAIEQRGIFAGITNTVHAPADVSDSGHGPKLTIRLRKDATIKLLPRHDDIVSPGPFLRIRFIQSGGNGKVVAVRDMKGGREVRGRPLCAKIFTKAQDQGPLVQELSAYKALSARTEETEEKQWPPYVIRLEASLEEANRTFFFMDMMYCDLMDVLWSWEYDARKIYSKRWVTQIATGLAAIHATGIIHRDIKPENIFVDHRFNVRIGDFGCAYINPKPRPIHAYGEYSNTVCGTWPYLAPELVANRGKLGRNRRNYSLGVDYWALGCIVFELEMKEYGPLFEHESDLEAYRTYRPIDHSGRRYPKFCDLSLEAESLITGLLRPRSAHRFGIVEIRQERYFRRLDGYNEFHNIVARGYAINALPVGTDIPSDHLNFDDSQPVIYCPAVYPEGHHPGDNNGWINPFGIWGTMLTVN